MQSHQLLCCSFPDVLADYFDVVDIQESVSQFDFWLDERNFMEILVSDKTFFAFISF